MPDVALLLTQLLSPPLTLLRPYLLPVTSNLPPLLSGSLHTLLGDQCYPILITHLDPALHPPCLLLAISKVLGLAIILLSTIVKLPQLLKILHSRSATGVSLTSYLLETFSLAVTLAYSFRSGYPVSTYGESGLIALQNAMVVVALLWYSDPPKTAWIPLFLGIVVAGTWALGRGFPMEWVQVLQVGGTVPIGLAAKAAQVWDVYKVGSTGQLSGFAVLSYVGGSAARVFTTLQEVDDVVVLVGYVGGLALNLVVGAQMLWYWGEAEGKKEKKEKKVASKGGVGKATGKQVQGAEGAAKRRRKA